MLDIVPVPAHVVVVEDSLPDVLLVEEALRAQAVHYTLTRFKDGKEALDGLPGKVRSVGRADVIVLDLNMPRMGGLELLARLRSDRSFENTPIAILTSSLQPSEREAARRLGATRFVRKAVDLHKFLDEVGLALRELIERHGQGEPPRWIDS